MSHFQATQPYPNMQQRCFKALPIPSPWRISSRPALCLHPLCVSHRPAGRHTRQDDYRSRFRICVCRWTVTGLVPYERQFRSAEQDVRVRGLARRPDQGIHGRHDRAGAYYVCVRREASSITQDAEGVRVDLANGTAPAQFDLVVGAEGVTSRTSRLLFSHGPTNNEYVHRLEQYTMLFTIPWAPEDTKFAQWYRDSWPPFVPSTGQCEHKGACISH